MQEAKDVLLHPENNKTGTWRRSMKGLVSVQVQSNGTNHANFQYLVKTKSTNKQSFNCDFKVPISVAGRCPMHIRVTDYSGGFSDRQMK
jgi:hypothetical protein